VPLSPLVRARLSWPIAAAALATTLSLSVASASSAAPVAPARSAPAEQPDLQQLTPSDEAARAGVERGNAYMGWKTRSSSAALSPALLAAAATTQSARSGVQGIDVASWQRSVNWRYWKARGKSFAYVKATEGTSYSNPYFPAQYRGAAKVGMFRGAYHFGIPNGASGSAQARYFVAHGGAWKANGRTLPGVLDIEYNPYGSTCYGLSDRQMVAWVKSFTRRYKALTGRDAVIYTTTGWWARCTGNSKAFNRTNPLWIARYAGKVGKLPGGWNFYTFWQYTSKPLDQDRFSAKRSRLVALAKG